MNVIGKILKLTYVAVIIFMVATSVLVAASVLPIPGSIKLFTVQSGSMEPAIKTGSVVITRPQSTYQLNDIITFKSNESSATITHRLVGMESNQLQTKGDANDAPDGSLVSPDLVVGKVIYSVPYIGYPVNFARTKEGLLLLIVIPATIIIYSEILSIKNEIVRIWKEKHHKNETAS